MTLRIENETIDVTTMSATKPDPDWRFTDKAGHEHRYVGAEVPTAEWVVVDSYFCPDCHENHDDHELQCLQCHETIQPHRLDDSGPKTMPGMTRYYIDDREVTKDQAEHWLTGLSVPQETVDGPS